ncbi:MAG TPA: TMEM175 family protein [Candidatus Krumholzibacteria bacterium]|nr:TMEM175 family protein [Candidatus Krumholzibacteria bacterium]
MAWTAERLAALPVRGGLRQRGLEITRLETFCDAAYAIAVTLLVIAGGDVPTSFAALVAALKDVPAFLGSFAAIAGIWLAHRSWSRTYGLEDGLTIVLSLAMVFVMLVYVYPLRMVASAFAAYASNGHLPSAFVMNRASDLTGLFVVYGLGFALQMVMLALLYLRALKAGRELGLDDGERRLTRHRVVTYLVLASSGLLSALWAGLLPPRLGVWAGFVYTVLPVVMPVLAIRQARAAGRT